MIFFAFLHLWLEIPNEAPYYSMINSVDFHPKQNIFCAAYTQNNKVSLYEIDPDEKVRLVQTLSNPSAQLAEPQHAVFSPDGERIVVASWAQTKLTVYVREENGLFANSPSKIVPFPKPLRLCKPHGICFSPNGEFFAIACGASKRFKQAIALFRGEDFQCLDILHEPLFKGAPKGISFTPDSTHLIVTFCDPSSLSVFRIEEEGIQLPPIQVLEDPQLSRPEDLKFSSCGALIAISNSDQDTVTFYRFVSNTFEPMPFWTLPDLAFPHGIAFSSDGHYLAATQFGPVSITPKGDVQWNPNLSSKEGLIHLYKVEAQDLKCLMSQ
jgi:6-phosphogluconolactonase (cycloisomerase 2 family)